MRANAFAAAFLLPAAGVRGALSELHVADGRVQREHVVHLMHHFAVSYDAVAWRLLNLAVISRAQRDELIAAPLPGLARALGYEEEPGADEPAPSRRRAVAVEAWRNEIISTAKLAELLGLDRREVTRLFGRPDPAQPRVERAPAAEPDWF
jgi:Zn-dependent peptidase ImmA (M78 family)